MDEAIVPDRFVGQIIFPKDRFIYPCTGATISWPTEALVLNGGTPSPCQSVAWQTGSGLSAAAAGPIETDSGGIAAKLLTAGPLSEGQQATASACLNGTSQCVTFKALGARPEYASMQPLAGTRQTMAASATPSLITLRVLDMDGNPMAGASVTLYQSLYAWAPPCPARGRCVQPEFLGAQTAVATSALDGTVSFTPASLPGVATNMLGVAATGNASTLAIAIEQHP